MERYLKEPERLGALPRYLNLQQEVEAYARFCGDETPAYLPKPDELSRELSRELKRTKKKDSGAKQSSKEGSKKGLSSKKGKGRENK